jgi:DNA-binding response OmpR family regulator
MVDVPTAATARATELADEFGAMLTRLLPGSQAHRAFFDTAVARRDSGHPHDPPGLGLTIDVPHRLVTLDGAPLRFSYREFELLRYLSASTGRPVSRAELMREVWCDIAPRLADPISERTVDTHVRRLRVKLGRHAHVIVTVRGRGYRFDPSPEVRVRAAAG